VKYDVNKDSLWKKICKNFQTVQEVTGSIEKEKIVPTKVSWVPGFYSIPASIPLARTEMYQKGEIYGMDISSGYAVTLLNIQPGK
jgi:16S rRNA C967 or C1407 C5-methylase (RsmB/RsmF family)